MKPDFGIWEKLPDGKVANMIDSKVTRLDELASSENIVREIGNFYHPRRVLDFGCGVGRNIVCMANNAHNWQVIGYDNAAMIRSASKYLVDKIPADDDVTLLSDWGQVLNNAAGNPFDTIFCCVSLQHIPEPQLREYLADFKKIGKELFVFGRRAIDPDNIGGGYDGGEKFVSVWDVILDSGFEIVNAQDGFIESSSGFNKGNGNDHHWVRFKPKEEINVRHGKRKRSFQD